MFSAHNAIEYRPTIDPEWKTSPTDERKVPLGVPLAQPVKVWLLYDACFNTDPAQARQCFCKEPGYAGHPGCIPNHPPCTAHPGACSLEALRRVGPRLLMNKAWTLYGEQFAGISFAEQFVDLSQIDDTDMTPLGAAVRAARGVPGCKTDPDAGATLLLLNNVKNLAEPSAPTNRLDVFMVRSAAANGVWCGIKPEGANVIVLDAAYRAITLAHEFGHAFFNSGERISKHVVTAANGSYAANLMQAADTDEGERLTLGQLFRAAVDDSSSINRHNVRPGESTENCLEFDPTDKCPPAWCDIQRDDDSTLVGRPKCAPLP